jgi:hypothetical protein
VLSAEEIDLATLAEALRARVGSELQASYLRGKTILRDTLQLHLGCSDRQAEELIETLELQGFIRFPLLADETHPSGRRWWVIGRSPLV